MGLTGVIQRFVCALIITVAAFILFTSGSSTISYGLVLFSLLGIIPLIALELAIAFWKSRHVHDDSENRRIFLLFAVVALFRMIQFPLPPTFTSVTWRP